METCNVWNTVEIGEKDTDTGVSQTNSDVLAALFDDKAGKERLAKLEGTKQGEGFPGALNQGWEYYFEWAVKDHSAWENAFLQAECQRLQESERWLRYYTQVFADEKWWKKLTYYALNAVQLWALYRQFKDQKEIADRTYEIANRIQTIAEELFAFYKTTYYPHEVAFGQMINDYFANSCIDYGDPADKFEENTRRAFARAKANWLQCSSSHCGGVTEAMLRQWEIELAQAVGNARTGAYRYAETVKEKYDLEWINWRVKYIQLGKEVSKEGQQGILRAFNTFNGFGADPGAALGTLLSTVSSTISSQLNSPTNTLGTMPDIAKTSVYDPYLTRVKQSGDVQVGKQTKASTKYAG